MTRLEEDKLIADFTGIKMLSKIEYVELVTCPAHEVDDIPEYYPTFYSYARIMPIAEGIINGYYDDFDVDNLM